MKFPIVISAALTSGKVISFQLENAIHMDALICALSERSLFVIPGEPFRALNCAEVCHVAAVK
jgi:hypothetical protein